MQKHNLRELVEYGASGFLSKVLVKRSGHRLVLINIRAGQTVSEPATNETITIYALSGHVTLYRDGVPTGLRAGEVLWDEGNPLHRLEAHEDSSLLVVAAGNTSSLEEELDLRVVEPFERHPLVFTKFDMLAIQESLVLINDHAPVPLHRQMEAMRPHQFTWEYITRCPDFFRIRICRIAPADGSATSPLAQTQALEQHRPVR